jgi:coenzyme F420 biosynthesis associated uncharacterized protein
MPGDNGTVSFAADRLVDWGVARATGGRVSGPGPSLSSLDRARLFEDFAETVPEAEEMVTAFTGLDSGNSRSRPWVMTRRQWVEANLRGFERLLDPFARKVLVGRSESALAGARRATLGVQIGGLLGYLGRRVLGQYDVFLPPDDDGLIYFVGPNVVALERRFQFPEREFRLWLCLHEVAHRVQFGGTPWLRGYLGTMMDDYLGTLDLDPKWLLDTLRRSVDEVRASRAELHGLGWMFLFMTPDQRELVRRMQAVMSLLEGHSTYVMNQVAGARVPEAAAFHRTLHHRRTRPGVEKMFQKAIGFDAKTRQYGVGERFVSSVIERVGMDGFNKVWERPENLPSMHEVQAPETWVARVATR